MTYSKKKIPVYSPEEGYNKYAPYYDQAMAFLDSFEKGYFQRIKHFFGGKKVLDAGCGTGRNTVRFLEYGAEVTAVDVSAEMLKKLKNKKSLVKTIQADVIDLPLNDELFDIVVSNLVLGHLYWPEKAIAEFYRVLKNDGELYLTVIHEKKRALLKDLQEKFKIESYYHSAAKINKILLAQAFNIVEENEIIEGGVRISTVYRCRK
jgi:ubiquinone/menaquinone biosynthesis C-methylase UbiE